MSVIITNTSGGKSSMAQAIIIKTDPKWSEYDEQICVFANTEMENEETLSFIDRCDKHFGLNVVWLEAVVNPKGKGNTHRVTNFENAYRINQYKDPNHPFHAHVRKNGIPNRSYPQCSDRLKEHVIESYRKSSGLTNAKQALGFRVDEKKRACSNEVASILSLVGVDDMHFRNSGVERMRHLFDNPKIEILTENQLKKLNKYSEKLNKYNLVFPMCDWFPMTKEDVNFFWESQPFTLELEEHEGNCATCWKKSDKKLFLLAKENEDRFEAFKWFEEEYKTTKAPGGERRFFRGNRTVDMLIGDSKMFDAWSLRKMIGAEPAYDGCSESCNGYEL